MKKTIIVIGAGRGLGFAVAKKFGKEGYSILAEHNKNKH